MNFGHAHEMLDRSSHWVIENGGSCSEKYIYGASAYRWYFKLRAWMRY